LICTARQPQTLFAEAYRKDEHLSLLAAVQCESLKADNGISWRAFFLQRRWLLRRKIRRRTAHLADAFFAPQMKKDNST